MFGALIPGEFCHVNPAAPKLAGAFVVVKGVVGKIAKVCKVGVGGEIAKAEHAIWAPWLETEEPAVPEWLELGEGC